MYYTYMYSFNITNNNLIYQDVNKSILTLLVL